ncbi:hypothetical protein DN069_36025 [Streptacidiphilus pinicola]|uniref:Uncharacterized protein n=1 Tax=Streptacidiphilus pinicola TaxID=2219663 RepID=A0A2X0J0K4_9ACTN|nr:hypothetical protein [Streptacidiphilus pinicola]RAG80828.1 hypothetical protein DN069_36025 [Streptacidiphilus pinicola]
MHGSRRNAWLGLTPEPERELPHAVARLRGWLPDAAVLGTAPSVNPVACAATAAERRRVERLILHGNRRSWLGYLREVAELVADVASGIAHGEGPPGPQDVEAALVAGEVVLAHHQMLIGLPGPAYHQAAADRALLTRAVDRLRRLQPGSAVEQDPEAGPR